MLHDMQDLEGKFGELLRTLMMSCLGTDRIRSFMGDNKAKPLPPVQCGVVMFPASIRLMRCPVDHAHRVIYNRFTTANPAVIYTV